MYDAALRDSPALVSLTASSPGSPGVRSLPSSRGVDRGPLGPGGRGRARVDDGQLHVRGDGCRGLGPHLDLVDLADQEGVGARPGVAAFGAVGVGRVVLVVGQPGPAGPGPAGPGPDLEPHLVVGEPLVVSPGDPDRSIARHRLGSGQQRGGPRPPAGGGPGRQRPGGHPGARGGGQGVLVHDRVDHGGGHLGRLGTQRGVRGAGRRLGCGAPRRG